jgi:hypothetical protein
MQYLVTAEWVEVGPLLPLEKFVPVLDRNIIPSLETLAQWEEEGRIYGGGVYPGQKAGAWVIEAESSEELGRLVSSLPFWGQMKWHVRPLQSTRSAAKREQRVRERLNAMVAGLPAEPAAQAGRQGLLQRFGSSSGSFFGQEMTPAFSYLILACVLWLVVVWAALTAMGIFNQPNLLGGIFALFVSFNLGAFLFAVRVESWYLALARSVSIALLGYGAWILALSFFSPLYSVGEALHSPSIVILDAAMIGVSAAAVGLAAAGVNKLRLTLRLTAGLGIPISLFATGIQLSVWLLVWNG